MIELKIYKELARLRSKKLENIKLEMCRILEYERNNPEEMLKRLDRLVNFEKYKFNEILLKEEENRLAFLEYLKDDSITDHKL